MRKCIVIGAGGHAKIVLDILQEKKYEIVGLTDPNIEKGELCMGYPVLGTDEVLRLFLKVGVTDLVMGIGHTGNFQVRNQVYQNLQKEGFEFPALIHKNAIKADSAVIDKGVLVAAGSIINPEAKIGELCIINTSSVIEHEVIIESGVHIAPHATILGNAFIGENSFIGAGSVVLQGVKVGRNCIIGAGSIILKDIPDNSIVYGNPGVVHGKR